MKKKKSSKKSSKKSGTWEVFEVNLEKTKLQIKKSNTFIEQMKNSLSNKEDTIYITPEEIDDAAEDLAKKLKRITEDVVEVTDLTEGTHAVLRNTENDTLIAFKYDPRRKTLDFLDSGGQGAIVFGKLPLEERGYNYSHAYTRLKAFETIMEKQLTVDDVLAKVAEADKQARKLDERIVREYVQQKIGYLYPKGKCIIKVYHASGDSTQHLAEREAVMQGFYHKNLVHMFAQGKVKKNGNGNGGWYYAVMEYVPVVSSAAKTRMTFKDRIGIAEQTLACLEDVFLKVGLVHRDIKPDNLLLFNAKDIPADKRKEYTDPNGEKYRICAKITDTGLIKTLRQDSPTFQTMPGIFLGTPEFAAPEDAAASLNSDPKHRPSWRGDLYSVGASLYYYLTGRPPNQPPQPDDSTQLFMNCARGNHKALMPSETLQLHKYLEKEFKDNKERKRVAYWLDLVLAGMLWTGRKVDGTNLIVERSLRYKSLSDCIEDLCAVKNGKEPEKIRAWLRENKVKESKYIADAFTYVTTNVPEKDYKDYASAMYRYQGKPLGMWLKRLIKRS